MHACLYISEIFAIICNELRVAPNDELDSAENKDLASLAVLARTSRIFYELALNALWCGIPNLIPLLLCMPSDLIGKRKTSSGYTELVRPNTCESFIVYPNADVYIEVPAKIYLVNRLVQIRLSRQTRAKLGLAL